jgi:broad specificity phosphatase PhoE
MPNLVFIRHSQTQPDSNIPSPQWSLTEEGRRRCEPLAERLIPYNLGVIVTSKEPKAIQTGEIIAQKLGIPCRAMKNLQEHARDTALYFETREDFLLAVNNLFTRPDKLVFGEETGREARDRFSGAVESVLLAYPRENIAIVTHGTVLSLFASQYAGQDEYAFWQSLGMPAIIAFSHPEMKLLAQVNEIT